MAKQRGTKITELPVIDIDWDKDFTMEMWVKNDPTVYPTTSITGHTIGASTITSTSSGWADMVDANVLSEIKADALSERLEEIEKQLAIIRPDKVLQEKYPALQEAYDHYMTIKALVDDGKS